LRPQQDAQDASFAPPAFSRELRRDPLNSGARGRDLGVTPIAGCLFHGKTHRKRMITGRTPISRNLHRNGPETKVFSCHKNHQNC